MKFPEKVSRGRFTKFH